MKHVSLCVLTVVVVCASLGLSSTQATSSSPGPESRLALAKPNDPQRNKIAGQYGQLPLAFEENRGQTDAKVKFLARGRGYALFLTPDEAVFSLVQGKAPGSDGQMTDFRSTVLRAKLVGANPRAQVSGEDQLEGVSNYLADANQSKWRTNIRQFGRVRYTGVYQGIDLVYYGNQRELEYDFIVAPGADSQNIRLSYAGAESLAINPNGNLIITTASGELMQRKPVIYQLIDGRRKAVDGGFVIGKNRDVTFAVASYDAKHALIIDPQLGYSTYLGGINFDNATSVAVDKAGNAYITGSSGGGFPTTSGSLSQKGSGIYIAKLNPAGNKIIYATYVVQGGDAGASGIAVDSTGAAYITGRITSSNIPATPGAFQTQKNAGDMAGFVIKLNPAGNAVAYGTYFGKNLTIPYAIVVDASGSAYICGVTGDNFPVTPGAFQTVRGNTGFLGDGFIIKFNPSGSALAYATYLGGSDSETVTGIAVDSNGSVYATGITGSGNFPTTANAYRRSYTTTYSMFATKFNPAGSALVYSTFFGGNGFDTANGIALDNSGNAYITGNTSSTDFPVSPSASQRTYGGGLKDAFVVKFNAAGSALMYATYLGGSGEDAAAAIAVDGSGNAYVTGGTNSTNFPATAGVPQSSYAGGSNDAFVTKINATGTTLAYSTYLGGNLGTYTNQYREEITGYDTATAIALDSCGSAYVVGNTESYNFPVTLTSVSNLLGNSLQSLFSINTDGFVTKIISGNSALPLIGGALLGINC